MADNDPTDPEAGDAEDRHHAVARKNRGIRFSDPEWEEVRQAAQHQGITPAEFVRDTFLRLIRNPSEPDSAALPVALAPLIERSFRYTYMLASKMRDDMIDAGDRETLEQLIEDARKLQDAREGP